MRAARDGARRRSSCSRTSTAADEATLDVLRLLARRIDGAPGAGVATYRDVGLDRWHPLRIVLGEISAVRASTRLGSRRSRRRPSPRSPRQHGVDADELYRKTGGNPFFVTEALAAADEEIPATVRDAVLGRAARLSPDAQDAARRDRRRRAAGRAVAAGRARAATRPTARGMPRRLAWSGRGRDAVAFCHELARLAVEESIPADSAGSPCTARPSRARRPARAVRPTPPGLPTMRRRPATPRPCCGSRRRRLRRRRLGAHREAAIHYGQALRFADLLQRTDRSGAARAAAPMELFLTVEFDEAVASAQEQALRCCPTELGDARRAGRGAEFLRSELLWQPGTRCRGPGRGPESRSSLLEGSSPGSSSSTPT